MTTASLSNQGARRQEQPLVRKTKKANHKKNQLKLTVHTTQKESNYDIILIYCVPALRRGHVACGHYYVVFRCCYTIVAHITRGTWVCRRQLEALPPLGGK